MKTEKEYLNFASGSYLMFPSPKTSWGLMELTIHMERQRQRSLTYWNKDIWESWRMLLKLIQVMDYLILTHR